MVFLLQTSTSAFFLPRLYRGAPGALPRNFLTHKSKTFPRLRRELLLFSNSFNNFELQVSFTLSTYVDVSTFTAVTGNTFPAVLMRVQLLPFTAVKYAAKETMYVVTVNYFGSVAIKAFRSNGTNKVFTAVTEQSTSLPR